MPSKRIFIKIYGDVIGVNFRYYTRKFAQELGIFGYVKNCADQTVEIEAEGDEEKLKQLLDWAHQVSEWARVDKVEHKWQGNRGEFEEFYVRY
ncbi:MAG: acylphosphatase [Candidatus Kuenenbacteria bacterium]